MTQAYIESNDQARTQPLPTGPGPSEAEGQSRRRAGRRLLVIGAVVVVALGGALAVGTLPRMRQQQHLDVATAQAAAQPPRVTVAVARRVAPTAERILPGNSLPLMEAALFARTTGYVSRWLVDIGDRVKQGQLLAEISAPDVDDQLAQARANLKQAQANLRLNQANLVLARTTLARSQEIQHGAAGAVSQQEIDQEQATVGTATASVAAARATIGVNQAAVQQFTDLQGFEKIIAPFPGVVTARNIDPGDLVTANSTARELFHVMRTDILRVFVNVPQAFATGIQTGQGATVYRREEPHKQYQGKVTRTADALDPNTRTLLTEVDVPNPKDALRPGMYLQVKFAFERNVFPLMIPSAALATRTKGPRVAVLDDQHRVHYRDVELGRDYGAEVEVVAGLKDGDTVVVHPGDDIPEGTAVESVPLPK
ncbi:MAG TPA: efflux RND transporter periplasmic adaptor subunit [Gemmataceae bacterium]|nr:efflux RND transporter periplasmic adaptor subunit [Gemmataceae bacterium]